MWLFSYLILIMKLKDILKGVDYKKNSIIHDLDIENIDIDSRNIKKNGLFIAIKGSNVDGNSFIPKAIENGAVAIITEDDQELPQNISKILVDDCFEAMRETSSNFYNRPWENLKLIGITGTSGKTSTTYYTRAIFEMAKRKMGLVGTICAIADGKEIPLLNTTPVPIHINSILHEMVEAKEEYVVMEVSSQAISTKRVDHLHFKVGVFTNLSKDHLDYHLTMESYFLSKSKLFSMTDLDIINIDDPYGKRLYDMIKEKYPKKTIYTYSANQKADIYASNINYLPDKTDFTLNIGEDSFEVELNTPGEFNVYNALAAASIAYSQNIDLKHISEGLHSVNSIKGRFQVLDTKTDFTVIIDFAHTPAQLEKLTKTIAPICKGRSIIVFGAGGNRDKTKRPEMGNAVGMNADIAIVTTDNPRKEDPKAIIDDIIPGIENTNCKYEVIVSRVEAIHRAIDIAQKDDIIVIAGKGHETYQIIGTEKHDFNEEQIVMDYINSKRK